MSNDNERLGKIGGISFVASGVLFFAKYLLDVVTGPPPSSGAEILAWIAAHRLPLSFVNEILFFAAMSLVFGVVALYRRLAEVDRVKATIGCAAVGAIVPVLLVALIVHGRLVYPIYGLRVHDPAIAELVVSVYYGGLHAVLLVMAGATIVLALALRRAGGGWALTSLGIATGVFDVAGAYPDLIGPVLLSISQSLFAGWLVAVGVKLFRSTR